MAPSRRSSRHSYSNPCRFPARSRPARRPPDATLARLPPGRALRTGSRVCAGDDPRGAREEATRHAERRRAQRLDCRGVSGGHRNRSRNLGTHEALRGLLRTVVGPRTGVARPDMMALFQISEPDAPAPAARAQARDRHRSRHDQLARRHGAQRHSVGAARRGGPAAGAVDRALCRGRGRGRVRRDGAPGERPQNTIVSVKRFMGRGLADLADDRRFPYRFVDAPGMVQIAHARRREEPGRDFRRPAARAARARGSVARRADRRRGGHRARVLRRRAAAGDQGRRAPRRPATCCAC